MLFRLYNSLMGLAKESLAIVGPEGAETGKGPDLVDLGPETDPELMKLVHRLKELLTELSKANRTTLRYIVRHLRRYGVSVKHCITSFSIHVLLLSDVIIPSRFDIGLLSWRRTIR